METRSNCILRPTVLSVTPSFPFLTPRICHALASVPQSPVPPVAVSTNSSSSSAANMNFDLETLTDREHRVPRQGDDVTTSNSEDSSRASAPGDQRLSSTETARDVGKSGSSGGRSRRHTSRLLTCHDLPVSLHYRLLLEAVVQRDCPAITGLVANWPDDHLDVRRLIPPEEVPLAPGYLTRSILVGSQTAPVGCTGTSAPSTASLAPSTTSRSTRQHNHNPANQQQVGLTTGWVDGGWGVIAQTRIRGPSLLDAFMIGLLTRQPACRMTSIDFTGFEEGQQDHFIMGSGKFGKCMIPSNL
ncbi:unnamed protein product [Protopolystoma xenopodis]|uniref:Uncharacterized protein n=1 Tax=Protopolystoma xenopodis TaxID=117903 RepID=A0A3S5C459_9PLAT|nr:unnamed protein product [Protopolystoma xenopodis]